MPTFIPRYSKENTPSNFLSFKMCNQGFERISAVPFGARKSRRPSYICHVFRVLRKAFSVHVSASCEQIVTTTQTALLRVKEGNMSTTSKDRGMMTTFRNPTSHSLFDVPFLSFLFLGRLIMQGIIIIDLPLDDHKMLNSRPLLASSLGCRSTIGTLRNVDWFHFTHSCGDLRPVSLLSYKTSGARHIGKEVFYRFDRPGWDSDSGQLYNFITSELET